MSEADVPLQLPENLDPAPGISANRLGLARR